MTKTVVLDVGGTTYKVSRSLIEKFPDTMLARLTSDTWQPDAVPSEKAIFIEADGEQFRYVLAYMRYGKVHLPLNISKGAVLQDLDYFGFDEDGKNINDGCSNAAAAMQMYRCQEHVQKGIAQNEARILYLNIAWALFVNYSKTGKLSWIFSEGSIITPKDFSDFRSVTFDPKVFEECLAVHGLAYVKHELAYVSNIHYLYITLKLFEPRQEGTSADDE